MIAQALKVLSDGALSLASVGSLYYFPTEIITNLFLPKIADIYL